MNTLTSVEAFTFTSFIQYVGENDISSDRYSIILRAVFAYVESVYGILLETLVEIPFDLQLAVFNHARWLQSVAQQDTGVISSVTDSSGNKVSYEVAMPFGITSTYERYSVAPLAIV